MNALAKPDVGQYLNDHFVAAFQKVATFKIVNGQKQGGNVASYFCTPDGQVLDAVAGPVDGPTLLREARWVVETCNLADLDGKGGSGLKEAFRKAHADRLLQEHGLQSKLAPRTEFTTEDVAAVLDRGRGLDNAGRIHLLLATYPLAPIGKVYRPIFERVLNETVSTTPVQLGDAARAPRRVLAPTAADEQEDRREAQAAQARNDPPAVEILSGRALNVLLTDLRGLDEKGRTLADVALDEAVMGGFTSSPAATATSARPCCCKTRCRGRSRWLPTISPPTGRVWKRRRLAPWSRRSRGRSLGTPAWRSSRRRTGWT